MVSTALEAMLSSEHAFAVAAAGCGKTELLGQVVADKRSGRQLVLTHTHAGVAAIKKRLSLMGVPREKFHLDTIAGWSLRYGAAYPGISGLQPNAQVDPDWESTYPGAEKVCRTSLGKRVVRESYDGVLVDEYQDCSVKQHALVSALAECVPCRGVGDPLQTVFGFREDPVVPWSSIERDFEVVNGALTEPWRWRRAGHNRALGEWLVSARQELESTGRLVISIGAPVTWVEHGSSTDATGVWADACRGVRPSDETAVAIIKWPGQCIDLARRLSGRWPVVERFDDPDLLKLSVQLAGADGPTVVAKLVKFVGERMTGVGADLKTAVEAIKAGRGVSRISKNREDAERLCALASEPTPANALKWLEQVIAHRGDWWLYRRECVFQLREALRHCTEPNFSELPDMAAAARMRARHRGRLTSHRTVGTPLLVKGLEFDHVVLLWDPAHLSLQGLYVALTRASKSLTVVSRSRTLVPDQT